MENRKRTELMDFTRNQLHQVLKITKEIKNFTTYFQSEDHPTIDKVLLKIEDMILVDLNPNLPTTDPRYFDVDGKVS